MDKQTRQLSAVRETKAQDAVIIIMINLMMKQIIMIDCHYDNLDDHYEEQEDNEDESSGRCENYDNQFDGADLSDDQYYDLVDDDDDDNAIHTNTL